MRPSDPRAALNSGERRREQRETTARNSGERNVEQHRTPANNGETTSDGASNDDGPKNHEAAIFLLSALSAPSWPILWHFPVQRRCPVRRRCPGVGGRTEESQGAQFASEAQFASVGPSVGPSLFVERAAISGPATPGHEAQDKHKCGALALLATPAADSNAAPRAVLSGERTKSERRATCL